MDVAEMAGMDCLALVAGDVAVAVLGGVHSDQLLGRVGIEGTPCDREVLGQQMGSDLGAGRGRKLDHTTANHDRSGHHGSVPWARAAVAAAAMANIWARSSGRRRATSIDPTGTSPRDTDHWESSRSRST